MTRNSERNFVAATYEFFLSFLSNSLQGQDVASIQSPLTISMLLRAAAQIQSKVPDKEKNGAEVSIKGRFQLSSSKWPLLRHKQLCPHFALAAALSLLIVFY